MTDDIVTQLRYIYSQRDVGVSVNPDTFTEAADEIERLRAEIERLQAVVVLCPKCYEAEHGVGRWKQVVHGEEQF